MGVRPILRMGEPLLAQVAAPVTDFSAPALAELIADMKDTMASAGGVGLAAPQIGVSLQVVVYGFERAERYPDATPIPLTVLINPRLFPIGDDEEAGWEGCLSVPGLRGEVHRFRRLRYEAVDIDGQPIAGEAEGFHARILQHECDHLLGRLYPTRMRDMGRFGFTDVLFPGVADADD